MGQQRCKLSDIVPQSSRYCKSSQSTCPVGNSKREQNQPNKISARERRCCQEDCSAGLCFQNSAKEQSRSWEEAACTVNSSNKSSKGEALGKAPKKSSQSFAAHQAKQSRMKPFNLAEIVLNSQIYYMLRYHFSYSIVTLTRSDILAREQTPERHRYSRYLQEIVRNCLSSEMHMYPLLSVTAGRMTIASKAHERHASHFMHNATRLLREYFLTPNPAIDSQIIRNILHLSYSEWYRGNHNAAWIHLHILARLVHVLDPENNADRYLLDNICCNDIYFAIETGATQFSLCHGCQRTSRHVK